MISKYTRFLSRYVTYTRCSGLSDPASLPARRPTSGSRYKLLAGAAGTGSLIALLGVQLTDEPKPKYPFEKPREQPTPPVQAHTVRTATELLRQHEGSQSFSAGNGRKGSFDYIRFASNSPVEDELDAATGAEHAPWAAWAIYDGHAGWATSSLLRQTLIPRVLQTLSRTRSPTEDIKQTFLDIDNDIFTNALQAMKDVPSYAAVISALAPAMAGSCALLSVYNVADSMLRVACVGDSRAVLGRCSTDGGYTCAVMSKDQTGFNKDEVERISAAHPGEKDDILSPSSGRLLGMAVSRAFGDHRWKWAESDIREARTRFFGSPPRPKYVSPPYMTAEPVIQETKVGQGDFLIMASDGFWDHVSSPDAVECVSQWLQAKKSGRKLVTPDISAAEEARKPDFRMIDDGAYADWKSKPEHFVVEDDNCATHLVKNAFGGSRRSLFCMVMSAYVPMSRNIRDDVTVQVIFF